MALLSRKVDYALLILSYLHRQEQGGCARAIAERFHLSRAFVANILKRLCSTGYVTSQRGIKGGYVLKKSAEEIILSELMQALEEPFHLTECCQEIDSEHCDISELCPVKGAVIELHHKILGTLRNVTLADLVRSDASPSVALEVSRCREATENAQS